MSKITINMAVPAILSTSAMTRASVQELRTISQRLQELTERAERIISVADEVFPAAKAGWLRKMKSALGLLNVRDGHSLEDTISYCERLVSQSSEVEGEK